MASAFSTLSRISGRFCTFGPRIRMEVSFEAILFNKAGEEGLRLLVQLVDGTVSFHPPGAVSTIFWSKTDLQLEKVPGSFDKWYLRKKELRFPCLLLENPVPGLTGKGKKYRMPEIALPGFGLLAIFLGLALVFGLMLFQGLPYLADQVAINIPASWEDSLGRDLTRQTLNGLEVDEEKTVAIRRLTASLDFSDSNGKIRFQPAIYVVRKSGFNAFALPGGSIMVHSAAIEKLNSPSALLALIGHENGHVQNRHGLRTLVRSVGLYGLFFLVAGDLGGLSALLVENARNLQSLTYSREFERHADQAAFQFLCRNHLSGSGLVHLMETMQGETKGEELPSFLSSHPLTEERLAFARQMLNQNKCQSEPGKRPIDSLFLELKNPPNQW